MTSPSRPESPRQPLDFTAWQSTLESDRQSVAGELHDELLPYLYAASSSINAIRRQSPELAGVLQQTADWLDQAREIAGKLMQGVAMPPEMPDGPLVAARHFVESVLLAGVATGDTTVQPTLHWHHLDSLDHSSLTDAETIAMYRIVCESVRNALRHASATEIHIEYKVEGTGVWIVMVTDNGVGIGDDEASHGAHGISLMHHRAKAAGFSLRLTSASEGRGTRVTFGRKNSTSN